MSAAKIRSKPLTDEQAARKIALYDSPGYLEVQRAQAALYLLETIDGDCLPTGTDHDTTEWCRSIAKNAIAESLAAAEKKIAESVKPADTKAVAS